jgi:hypothetical protein
MRKNRVIERKDAHGAADVKIAEAMRIVTCIKQDAGNEKTGEHEENVDAGPTPGQL